MKGLYTALITPFDGAGHLDEEGLRANIQYQLAAQVDGLVLLGTTGEAPTLSAVEKRQVISIAVEEAKGKVPLIVGTGNSDTKQAIANTHLAKELGADIAMVVTPSYNKPPQEGLYNHFRALADVVEFPILLYNHPGRTGQTIALETVQRLAEVPFIIGIKEASTDLQRASTIIGTLPEFTVLSGNDALTLPLMALGGHGVVSVLANLFPREMKRLTTAALLGDYAEARMIHHSLSSLFAAMELSTNPIPIKAAMTLRGMAAGPCRLPLCALDPQQQETLEQTLRHYDSKEPHLYQATGSLSLS